MRVVVLLRHQPHDVLLQNPKAGFILADSARRVGGVEDLLPFTAAIVASTRDRDAETYCDALNLYGVLLLEAGELQAAKGAWFDLVDAATRTDNATHVARASNNLGVAAILALELEDAITAFRRAVAAYMRIGYPRGLAQSHHNLGIVFRELGRFEESRSNFERAITFGFAADCLDDVARAELEMSLLYVYVESDSATAEGLVQSALARFTELGLTSGIANAMRAAGICALARGDSSKAEDSLHAALAIASQRKMRLLEAETLMALAALACKHGAQEHAEELKEQARRIFEETFAGPWGEQVALRMAAL